MSYESINSTSLKRIKKELKDLEEETFFTKFKYSPNVIKYLKSFQINIAIENYKESENLCIQIFHKIYQDFLYIKIPPCYPFKPYIIHNINLKNFKDCRNLIDLPFIKYKNYLDLPYFKFISNLNDKKIKIYDSNVLSFFYKTLYLREPNFLNLKNDECFCCNSVICSDKWSPSLRIDNILLELMEVIFIIKYNQHYNYLYIYNIYQSLFIKYFNKLPNEILDYIFKKMF